MSLPTPAAIDLSGEVAIVTGATSGLGLRFAQVLAGAGAAVAIAGRRAERLASLKAEIEGAGGTCTAITADMTSDADMERLIEGTEAEHARPLRPT